VSSDWKPGDHIQGRWELREVIDRGGMGLIYVVVERKDGGLLAAKTFKDTVFDRSPAIAERFIREAITWISLDFHRNVTPALYMDRIELKPFLFLPYIDGGDLSQWIGTPRLTNDLSQVLRFGIDICDGMTFIRSNGIRAHRDLKPQNCLITRDGILRITDFGISKVFEDLETKKPAPGTSHEAEALTSDQWPGYVTRTGMAVGTPAYMAPEQFLDAKHVTVRADIYSFGVILFEMITGRLPFQATTVEELAHLHMTAPPPRLDIHPGLMAVVETCLAKNPIERFHDFATIRLRLEQYYQVPSGHFQKDRVSQSMDTVMKLTRMADSLSVLGRHQEALAYCEQVLKIDGSYAWALLVKGKCLSSLGRLDEALQCLDLSSEIEPENEHVWRIKGSVLSNLGRHSDAITAFDHSLDLNPLRAEVWDSRGDELGRLRRHDAALRCYERALELDERHEQAMFGKSLTLAVLGRTKEALIWADRILELNPFNSIAADLKVGLLQQRGPIPYDRKDNLTAEDLGAMFASGDGVPKNYGEARRWYEKAAAEGSHEAMKQLAVLFANGSGVPQDYQRARFWFEKAVGFGNDDAMYRLGDLYNQGLGVPQDYKEAGRLFGQAAKAGHLAAMVELGRLYVSGHGVTANLELGRSWVEKAAATGDTNAQQMLKNEPFRRTLRDEAAAFYWFDSQAISDTGISFYGRFVYEQFLPHLAPLEQNNDAVWFVLFDGDCLAKLATWTWYFRKQDGQLLDEFERSGASLCYVIAVLGQSAYPLEDLDVKLRDKNVMGYLGMTLPGFFKRETFLRCQTSMALVTALRIDGRKLKRISYEFHSDSELRKIGFEPYSEPERNS